MKKLITYFINNPLIANVITVFILFAGFVLYGQIQKESYPKVDEPGVSINAKLPGASAEEVEIKLTIPIENALKEIEGIKNFSSNINENYCWVNVRMDDDADLDSVKNEIRRNLDTITNFPKEMTERPKLYEWGGKHIPLCEIGIHGDLPERELNEKVKDLKDDLLESPYIGKVDIYGAQNHEVHIRINLAKMNSQFVTFEEIVQAIAANNIQLTAGTIDSDTIDKKIVTISKFDEPLDVKNVVIRSNLDGNKITIGDVAEVVDVYHRDSSSRDVVRFNMTRGIYMVIHKKLNADIVKSSNDMDKILGDFRAKNDKSGLKITTLFNFSEPTLVKLKIVENNAIMGFFIVIFMLFIFLSFKNAFWTVLGIPISVCFGIVLMKFTGVTINSVSLLAMIVVLGMIVDDAIIISENIHRFKLDGITKGNYAVEATHQVAFAVTASVLTTIVAFVPLMFIKGVIGSYAREIPMVISFILIGSLLEALLILPSHSYHHLGRKSKATLGIITGCVMGFIIGRVFELQLAFHIMAVVIGGLSSCVIFIRLFVDDYEQEDRSFIIHLRNSYSRILEKLIHHKYATLGLLLIILVLAGFAASRMKFEMFPNAEANTIVAKGDTAELSSLKNTAEIMGKIETVLRKKFDEKTVKSIITIAGDNGNAEGFKIILLLVPESDRKLRSDDIIDSTRKILADTGYFKNLSVNKTDVSGPQLENSVQINVTGRNEKLRKEFVDIIENKLRTLNGLTDFSRSDQNLKEQIRITPKLEELARHGFSPDQISQIIRMTYEGAVVSEYSGSDESVPYRLILADVHRNSTATLDQVFVSSPKTKNLIAVSSLVDISKDSLLREIKRFNSYRTTEIYANYNPDKQKIIDVYNIINKKFKKPDPKFSGIKLNVGGSAEFSADMMNELKGSFAISLVAVFMILVFMFKSLLQPFIVALAIPFGIIGVIFSFTLHGMPLSFMGVMGVIGLSGVVVNDSIVMVDFINRERKENPHWSIADCVKNGAVLRLRPIILTSVTTVAGLLPTAYGIGGSDAMILPTAISLSWGLMFSTMFVLLFLPVFYLVIDDIKNMKIPFLTSSKNISGRHNHTSEIFSEAVIIDESHNLHYEIFTQEKEKLSPKRKAKSKR